MQHLRQIKHKKIKSSVIPYREVCDKLSRLGIPLKRSSARNHMMRAMRKLASIMLLSLDEQSRPTRARCDEIATSQSFQAVMAELLHLIALGGKWPTIIGSLKKKIISLEKKR